MERQFMERAVQLSREGMRAGDGGPFGAVIVRDGHIIAEGTNRVIATDDPTNHAEIIAIKGACAALGSFNLSGCEIYVNSEPCPMCLGAIYWAHLSKVFFANTRRDAAEIDFDDSLIYDELDKPLAERSIPFERFPHQGAREVFREWNEWDDKTPY